MNILPIQKLLKFQDAVKHKQFNPSLGYHASIKEDGWNIRLFKIDGIWLPAISSAGREIPSLQWISEYLNKKENGFGSSENIFLYAEAHNREIPFPIMNGMLNRKYEPCEDVQITIFDTVIGNVTSFMVEPTHLDSIADKLNKSGLNIFRPATQVGTATSIADFESIFSKYYEEEGIVFKKFGHVLAPGKRNLDLIKYKKEVEIDALCTSIYRTVGEKLNESLSIIVKRKSGVEFPVLVSKHSDQREFLADESIIVGKVVTITGMEELPSGKLRQPIFKYVRNDKNIMDID